MAQSDDEYAAAENARRLRDAVKRGTIAASTLPSLIWWRTPVRLAAVVYSRHLRTRRLERTISGRSRYCCF